MHPCAQCSCQRAPCCRRIGASAVATSVAARGPRQRCGWRDGVQVCPPGGVGVQLRDTELCDVGKVIEALGRLRCFGWADAPGELGSYTTAVHQGPGGHSGGGPVARPVRDPGRARFIGKIYTAQRLSLGSGRPRMTAFGRSTHSIGNCDRQQSLLMESSP